MLEPYRYTARLKVPSNAMATVPVSEGPSMNTARDAFWSPRGPLWKTLASRLGQSRDTTACTAIPHIIHHIWLGGPIPARLRRLVQTWKALHPSWIHLLWEDQDLVSLELFNQHAFDAASNLGQRSDILRYELLLALGGTYCDVDMQCIGSLDSLHAGSSFFCGVSNTAVFELNNAVIGCTPGHVCAQALVHGISRGVALAGPCCAPVLDGFLNTIEATGPGLLTRTVMPLLHAAEGVDDDGAAAEGLALLAEFASLADASQSRMERSRNCIVRAALSKLAPSLASLPCGGGRLTAHVAESLTSLRSTIVLPTPTFYPAPNSATLSLPLVAIDDEHWHRVYGDERVPIEESRTSFAWRCSAVGPDVAAFLLLSLTRPPGGRAEDAVVDASAATRDHHGAVAAHPDPLHVGVHYWAKTWQRQSAQLPVKSQQCTLP